MDEFSITIDQQYAGPSIDWALFPFQEITNDVLGKSYSLSLAIVTNKISKKVNSKYRGIQKNTDVLAFSLSENAGEILLNPEKATEKSSGFGRSPIEHILFLFIHACLHLKGLDHGDTMESEEKNLFKKFPPKERTG